MKLFIASDLHGSAFWTERVVQKFHESQADFLVLLGDVYNHGPRNPFPRDYAPMRVAQTLNAVASKLIVIKGNCDSEVDQMISNFEFLQGELLPFGSRKLFFTHGHVYNKNNLPRLSAGDMMFYGHFHKNEIVESNGVVCINVGSCSLPKDGKSTYCIVDDDAVTILDFDGNTVQQRKNV